MMLKIQSIELVDAGKIICIFNTGEKRLLELDKVLDPSDKYVQKITTPEVFKKAKVGLFGEIFWDGMGEIINYDGAVLPCNYDMSPEFVYYNSSDYPS